MAMGNSVFKTWGTPARRRPGLLCLRSSASEMYPLEKRPTATGVSVHGLTSATRRRSQHSSHRATLACDDKECDAGLKGDVN